MSIGHNAMDYVIGRIVVLTADALPGGRLLQSLPKVLLRQSKQSPIVGPEAVKTGHA